MHEVTILSGLIFSAAIFFALLGLGSKDVILNLVVSVFIGILMWRGQYYLYKRALDKHELLSRPDKSETVHSEI